MGGSPPKNLGHKAPSGREDVRGQAQGLQHQRGLAVGLAGPVAAHVWGAIVQHAVQHLAPRLLLDCLQTRLHVRPDLSGASSSQLLSVRLSISLTKELSVCTTSIIVDISVPAASVSTYVTMEPMHAAYVAA